MRRTPDKINSATTIKTPGTIRLATALADLTVMAIVVAIVAYVCSTAESYRYFMP